MIIQVNNPFLLSWTLTDSSGAPIPGATVTATLFAGRGDPTTKPGVPVPEIDGVTLIYSGSGGIYSAQIDPVVSAALGSNYVLVIDALLGSSPVYHAEEPTTLQLRNDFVAQSSPLPATQLVPKVFQPRYIWDFELKDYGLPTQNQLPTIMSMVDAASSFIDSYCGRIDGSGRGSLVYSTYTERELMPVGRNLCRLSKPPLVAVDSDFVETLASYNLSGWQGVTGPHFWSGMQPNTVVQANGNLSAMISASGRYGYGRRDHQSVYPDLNYGSNILMVAGMFGGPPAWTAIDPSAIEYYDDVGEIWVPAGLYMSAYTEIIAVFNAGFNPLAMPPNIKHACAALVRNFITRGGGVTAMTGYTASSVTVQFSPLLIDPNIEQLLKFYQHVVSM